ncbi:MAG: ABC transporter permease [Bacillota bacterium]
MGKGMQQIRNSKSFYSFISLIMLIVVASLFSPEFRTLENMITILRQASTLLVLSAGLTAVLITGSMDLSIGATAAFIGCICAQLLKLGVPTIGIFPIGLLIGALIGILNGFLVSVVGLPSFIATYATNWVVKGLSIIVMSGAVIYGLPENFTWFGVGYLGKIPVIIIIALIVVVFTYVLLQKTTWGRDIYSYGSNMEAARYSGVNLKKTIFGAFMLCSMIAAIGGLLMTARLNAAEAAMGDAYGLQTVAAVVVGGTSMLGGEGGVVGTVIGATLLTVIVNLMNLFGISSSAQPMVVGAVIILMVLIDSLSNASKERIKRRAIKTT